MVNLVFNFFFVKFAFDHNLKVTPETGWFEVGTFQVKVNQSFFRKFVVSVYIENAALVNVEELKAVLIKNKFKFLKLDNEKIEFSFIYQEKKDNHFLTRLQDVIEYLKPFLSSEKNKLVSDFWCYDQRFVDRFAKVSKATVLRLFVILFFLILIKICARIADSFSSIKIGSIDVISIIISFIISFIFYSILKNKKNLLWFIFSGESSIEGEILYTERIITWLIFFLTSYSVISITLRVCTGD